MWAVIGIIQLQQLFNQFIRLLIRQRMISFYSRLTCHGCNFFPDNLRHAARRAFDQLSQYFFKEFPYILTEQVNWNTPDGKSIHPKIFDFKAKFLEILLITVY